MCPAGFLQDRMVLVPVWYLSRLEEEKAEKLRLEIKRTHITHNFVEYEVHSYGNYIGVSGLGLVYKFYKIRGTKVGQLFWGE